MTIDVTTILHPLYEDMYTDWFKWRLAYQGGRRFIETFTEKFSSREDDDSFRIRKQMTPCPRFAGSAIDEIKNSIFQRMVDITRTGGTPSYQDCVNGGKYGVDRLGSSMNTFIGRKVLPELLVMKKVGIYVDMPKIDTIDLTLANNNFNPKDKPRPYIYLYTAEDILSWQYDDTENPNEYIALLVRETHYKFDPETRLPNDTQYIYKHFWMEDGLVYVQFYTEESEPIHPEPLSLNISRIPFHVLDLSHSLMAEAADYQIALLNLESSDISYCLKMNFPFYTEQFNPAQISPYLKSGTDTDQYGDTYDEETNAAVGVSTGRRYPIGTERPAFINPSPDTLIASMKKQEQIQKNIRLLVNLSITNLEPSLSSAESKGFDERSLESGLSYIGLELEHAERQIAQIWAMYENSKQVATIKYPEKYNLRSDEDRRQNCDQLQSLKTAVPSKTYQKEICKLIVETLLRNRVPDETLTEIKVEIDESDIINTDPNVISKDLEQGLVGLDTASKLRGYPPNEVAKAKQDHTDRLKRIAISQTKGEAANLNSEGVEVNGARGVSDLSRSQDGQDGKKEKKQSKDTTQDGVVTDKTRGEGK